MRKTAAPLLLVALLFVGGLTLAQTEGEGGEKPKQAPAVPATAKPKPKPNGKKAVEHPTVTIETGKGTIKLELFPEDAPLSVENFVTLAKRGYYDGLQFHRVVPNFVAQGGDPNSRNAPPGTKLGDGGPGYSIPDEATPNRKHEVGAVGMAKTSAPNSAGSQFYIVVGKPAPHLDQLGYTVFGKLVSGQEVAESLTEGDRMNRVTVAEPAGGLKPSPVIYRPALLVRMTAVKLPDITLSASERASVRVEFAVAPDGTAKPRLVSGSGNAAADEAVLQAVQNWKWEPATKDGKPVRSDREITIELPLRQARGN
jgi:peptidyl-prolyl cis-trans isomerase B (cyclophilin B)